MLVAEKGHLMAVSTPAAGSMLPHRSNQGQLLAPHLHVPRGLRSASWGGRARAGLVGAEPCSHPRNLPSCLAGIALPLALCSVPTGVGCRAAGCSQDTVLLSLSTALPVTITKGPTTQPCLHSVTVGERVQPSPPSCPAQALSTCGHENIQDHSPLLPQSCDI